MVTLSPTDRSTLERAVLRARGVAENGVEKRFAALDLATEQRPGGISDGENELRKALREHARNLGRGRVDATLPNQMAVAAGIPYLVEELAYEAWHRMLFARFLAENGLLLHPELGISLSIQDLRDLAAEQGDDPWELAATFAAERLPGLFNLTVPLRLAAEDRHDLAAILAALDSTLFTATDSLGWVYQFWQTERKKQVNQSGDKITGNTLPAVTQLFTEDYIVDFLLQNSLGAWFVSRYPDSRLKEAWPYLRFREDGDPSESSSRVESRELSLVDSAVPLGEEGRDSSAAVGMTKVPAAGTFPTWPDDVASITVMDPCCGSGHFLVAAFHMLVAMRREVEGLSAPEAADAVLRDNLYGLELDARCTQIATFALALEAWKEGGHPETHLPHIACSGIPVAGQKADWLKLANGDTNFEIALGQLYEQFSQAAELGSLIDPRKASMMSGKSKTGQHGMALLHEWDRVESRLRTALAREKAVDPAAAIFATDDLTGTMRAANLLSRTYTLIATNVPYLSRGSHGEALRTYADQTYPEAKNDLATLFLERCLTFVAGGDSPAGEPVGAGSVAIVTPQNWLFLGSYKKLRQILLERDSFSWVARLGENGFRSSQAAGAFTVLVVLTATGPSPDHTFAGLDASVAPNPETKAELLAAGELTFVGQSAQRGNPDSVIAVEKLRLGTLLEEFADGLQGIATADYSRYGRGFWERMLPDSLWRYQQSTVELTAYLSGREHMVPWDETIAPTPFGPGAYIRGQKAWGRWGVAVSQMRELSVTLYTGELFDNNTAVILPKNPDHLPAIWAFCSSPEFNIAVRKIDSALKVTNASLVKVPFDLDHWQKVADEQYPNGLPEPYSSDPTQWLFDGTVPDSDHPLQVAMARLLGYRWPEQKEDGLDDLADPDGIVCLPSIYQEPPAHQRLLELLQRAYGEVWSPQVLATLLGQIGAGSLETWLADRSGFFAQHVRLFHNRPFLWYITDGRKDGFSAIVNYHRLDAQVLSKLIHTYLGDWISRQHRAADRGETGAQARWEAATTLKTKLEAIAAGEPPYDIYVRWKSLAEQSIGWNPDLNDGVRLNIRPFIEAGVLAGKVTVNWNKDRGKDPFVRDEPLLKEATGDLRKRIDLHCSVDRHNDLHFSRTEKERARQLAKASEA